MCFKIKSQSSIFGKSKNNIIRSNIHTLNKDSFFFDSATGESRFGNRVSSKTMVNIKADPLLSFIEVCKGVDKDNSFRHELGHWNHTWFRPDIVIVKEAEEFAKNFNGHSLVK